MTFKELFSKYPEAIRLEYAPYFLSIKILMGKCEECVHHGCEIVPNCCSVEIERNAVLKTIPKKPNFIGDGYADGEMVYDEYECPNCGCIYETECSEGVKCCEECGQALDWR